MGKYKESPKQGPPAYMVSFCDMMTLILTFFILLVSMAKEQRAGLVAKGLGSFIVAIKTHGLDGIMTGQEKAVIFEHVRRRFNHDRESPAQLLGYVDRRMKSTELLTWRQDWGERSIHPLAQPGESIQNWRPDYAD